MIIVQTPLRVSFFGGGTDFSSFYSREGGCVLSSAIDKYLFVTIKQRFDDKIRVGYTSTEIVDTIDQLQHELIREALRKTGIHRSVEITTLADIPAGSGLGSSSAVAVGALHAMHAYKNELVTAEQLARDACEIEIDILKKPIGKQDQYISAYGGLRFLEFCPDQTVLTEKISLGSALYEHLNESLLLFYTGVTREAGTILSEQEQNTSQNMDALRQMKQLALDARKYLLAGEIDAIGYLLNETWQLKKTLASHISNGTFEDIYQKAIKAGALGGKITGAGGGGFFLFYCPPEKRQAVRMALSLFRELPFRLERDGTKVIFNSSSH
jgi:D-glycero-alpha-D-manno-heptose-7-phosphate kinase